MRRTGRPYHPILLDLDGTVADTRPGILSAVGRLTRGLGRRPPDPDLIHPWIGRGVENLVARVLDLVGAGPNRLLLEPAVAAYRRAYARTCVRGSRLYPGMRPMLRRLPRPVALVTNKPRGYTEPILRALKIDRLFDAVVTGDDPGAKLKPDPWLVREALRRLGIQGRPILVGDTAVDLETAEAARVPCCLVSWGYGSAAARRRAALSADSPRELLALLSGPPQGRRRPAATAPERRGRRVPTRSRRASRRQSAAGPGERSSSRGIARPSRGSA